MPSLWLAFVVCITEWIDSRKLACEGYVSTSGRVLARHMVNTNNPNIWEAEAGGCKLQSSLKQHETFLSTVSQKELCCGRLSCVAISKVVLFIYLNYIHLFMGGHVVRGQFFQWLLPFHHVGPRD